MIVVVRQPQRSAHWERRNSPGSAGFLNSVDESAFRPFRRASCPWPVVADDFADSIDVRPQCQTRPDLIVIRLPVGDLMSSLGRVQEPGLVQALVPDVEALGVAGRHGTMKYCCNRLLIPPAIYYVTGGELSAIVNDPVR